jgi:phosphonate transport system substrate-binding protein
MMAWGALSAFWRRCDCPSLSMRVREPLTAALAGLCLALLPAVVPSLPAAVKAQIGAASSRTTSLKLLRIGAIPDQNPEKLNRLYGLVARELSRQLGVAVKYVPVTDYAAAVSAFRTGDLDLVWFGGLTGVQASLQKPGARMLAQRDIDAQFYSVFIANPRSGLKPIRSVAQLAALRGKRFTFGSESSTSGRLMPQYFLSKAGVKLKDFAGGAPGFSGSHDATIALVQSGAYDVGAVNEQVWKANLRSGKANRSKVFQIWRTPPYPDYLWLAQPNLDRRFGRGFTRKLQTVIIGWRPSNPDQKMILALFGAQQFTEVNPAEYQRIENVGRQIGKIR